MIHTVHNVLPHERSAGDERTYRAVYGASDVLLVHSRAANLSALDPGPQPAPTSASRILAHIRSAIASL